MRDREAITAARQAVEDATEHVGARKERLQQELERRIEAEPELFEAFAQAGQAMLRLQQEKH